MEIDDITEDQLRKDFSEDLIKGEKKVKFYAYFTNIFNFTYSMIYV
jgi:hypothetical protein